LSEIGCDELGFGGWCGKGRRRTGSGGGGFGGRRRGGLGEGVNSSWDIVDEDWSREVSCLRAGWIFGQEGIDTMFSMRLKCV